VNIEVHHLVPKSQGGTDEIDNAMPLCFDCHSEVERYNAEHPVGTKFKPPELKARREQIYEEFTRHLVPPIHCRITQRVSGSERKRVFPDVGFVISHLGDSLPVRVGVKVESVLSSGTEVIPSEFYSGERLWYLNPRHTFSGHFTVPEQLIPEDGKLELRVTMSVIDQYGREHSYLPEGYVYVRERNSWYAEP
jgi:hypothetical protein